MRSCIGQGRGMKRTGPPAITILCKISLSTATHSSFSFSFSVSPSPHSGIEGGLENSYGRDLLCGCVEGGIKCHVVHPAQMMDIFYSGVWAGAEREAKEREGIFRDPKKIPGKNGPNAVSCWKMLLSRSWKNTVQSLEVSLSMGKVRGRLAQGFGA
ncbi:hypothetical protein SUGI_0996050 [Cryptomeria japonica]|nr:hypothetical protein SUGI_0996050 [Cryptomeria japonica]